MKKRTKKALLVVAAIILVLSYLDRGQGTIGTLVGLFVAIWMINWAFDAFMPKFFVQAKKKILKKIF